MPGRAGSVPTAMTILSAWIGSLEPSIVTVWSSSKQAPPGSQPTMLRRNCSRTTAVSAAIDLRGAVHQLLERHALRLLHARRVEHVSGRSRELLEHGLAQRLRRDRARVDGHAAEAVLALRDRDALAELRRLDGGLLPEGPDPMTSMSSSTRDILPDTAYAYHPARSCPSPSSSSAPPSSPTRAATCARPWSRACARRSPRCTAPGTTSWSSPRARSRAGCACSASRRGRGRSPSCRPRAPSARAGSSARTTSCCARRGSRRRRCCSRSST